MGHLTHTELVTYVDGETVAAGKHAVEEHLNACSDCSELCQELQSLMTTLHADWANEPPAGLLQWGIDLFQPVIQPSVEKARPFRKLIASLVFDSFEQPLLAGLRRVGAPPRQ